MACGIYSIAVISFSNAHCARRTLICTEQCLLHPSRNPDLGREGIEAALKEYLGLEKIIWLWKGMAGDDAITNGHVDNLACFVKPGVVLLSWTDDENDPQVLDILLLQCVFSAHTLFEHLATPSVSDGVYLCSAGVNTVVM